MGRGKRNGMRVAVLATPRTRVSHDDLERLSEEFAAACLAEFGTVEGLCDTLAPLLYLRLRAQGYDAVLVEGRYGNGWDWAHVWVELDGLALDPTRRQFDKQAPLVAPADIKRSDGREPIFLVETRRRPSAAEVGEDLSEMARLACAEQGAENQRRLARLAAEVEVPLTL